jgi:hypothetical protein
MIDSMPGRWHGWQESIPACWDRYDIAALKRKFNLR